jgi:membrane protease YdiL (CAAX protease family)
MLIPMIIPLLYTLLVKRESLKEIILISSSMIIIVIFYWPLSIGIESSSNILVKILLFVVIPLFTLYVNWILQNKSKKTIPYFPINQFGIKKEGLNKSLKLGILFTPLMLIITFIIKLIIGSIPDTNVILGVVSFVEAFTEEFFFRGILFLFLLPKTNVKIAYFTSMACFVLSHPQHFNNLFIISTIIQGFLTIEICRTSKNITGAWILHGANRFFSITVIPLFFT